MSTDHHATGDLRAGSARLGVTSAASQFITAARDFREGVDAVANSTRLWRVGAFLAGQSLECALKAYLSHDGVTEEKLKNEYAHHLGKAWREAAKRGLGIQEDPPQWCVLLDYVHDRPFPLRYPSELNGYRLPNGQRLADELTRLIDAVAAALERNVP